MAPTHEPAARRTTSSAPVSGATGLLTAFALGSLSLLGVSGMGCHRGVRGEVFAAPYQPIWKGRNKVPSYRVGLPGAGWEPLAGEGLQAVWQHSTDPAIISVHGECEDHGDSDLEDFTDHQRIDYSKWEIIQEPTGELDAEGRPRMRARQYYTTIADREALRTTVRANLDGADIMIEYVVLKKDGCLFDLTYVAVPDAFDQHTGEFEKVIEGFSFPLRK
jgi:hypothetical protein